MTKERKKAGIYTRKGDTGFTSLANKQKVRKSSNRICAVGSIDELNSIVGMVLPVIFGTVHEKERKFLFGIQEDLFVLGAELSLCDIEPIESVRIALLEEKIDEITGELLPLKNFILPGGVDASCHYHHARAVCRRVERDVVRVARREEVNKDIIIYLNRLSDLFFVWARYHNDCGARDILWKNER